MVAAAAVCLVSVNRVACALANLLKVSEMIQFFGAGCGSGGGQW